MIKSLFTLLCCTLYVVIFASSVWANEAHKGMKTLKTKEIPVTPSAESSPTSPAAIDTKTMIDGSLLLPLSLDETLVHPDDLRMWNHLGKVGFAPSNGACDKIIALIEADRGSVPPQGLLLAAQSLSHHKRFDEAALYFLVAQMRLTFDKARWPATDNENDKKEIERNVRKTGDQVMPYAITTPRLDNPHAGVEALQESVGAPIQQWMVKNPKRLEVIIQKAKEWEEATPYAYKTGYPVGMAIPYEEWKPVLSDIRDTYFLQWANMVDALNKL